jgi:hypothetical protein
MQKSIFISATTSDLGSYRQLASAAMRKRGYEVREQAVFGLTSLVSLARLATALTMSWARRVFTSLFVCYWNAESAGLNSTFCSNDCRTPEIVEHQSRAEGRPIAVPAIDDYSAEALEQLLSLRIRAISEKNRSAMLTDLGGLIPIVENIGGSESLVGVARVIVLASKFWP